MEIISECMLLHDESSFMVNHGWHRIANRTSPNYNQIKANQPI